MLEVGWALFVLEVAFSIFFSYFFWYYWNRSAMRRSVWTILAIQWTKYYLDVLVVTDRRLFYTSQINSSERMMDQWNIPDIRHVGARFSTIVESTLNYQAARLDGCRADRTKLPPDGSFWHRQRHTRCGDEVVERQTPQSSAC